jgi:hypothetical protein
VLRLSIEVEAPSFDEAIRVGRPALLEAVSAASLVGFPTGVVAMTDSGRAS